MITFETMIRVEGLIAYRIYRYFLQPGLREAGLRLHVLKRAHGDVGTLVWMDERIGERRVRAKAVITEAVPGRRLILRLKKWFKLPAWLIMDFDDVDGGVQVTHTVNLGYRGAGILFDPFLYLFFTRRFRMALREHLCREFAHLERLLYVDTSEW